MKNLVLTIVISIFCINLTYSQYNYVSSDSGIKSKTEVFYVQDKDGELKKISTTYSYFHQNGLPVYAKKIGEDVYSYNNFAYVYKPTDVYSVEGCKYGLKKPGEYLRKLTRESNTVLYSEIFSSEDNILLIDTIITKPYGVFHKQSNGIQVEYHSDQTKNPEGYSYHVTLNRNETSSKQLISDRKFNSNGDVISYVTSDKLQNHVSKTEIYYDYYAEEPEKYFNIKTSELNLALNTEADSNKISDFYNVMFFTDDDFYTLKFPQKNSDDICALYSRCQYQKISNLKTGDSYSSTKRGNWVLDESSNTTPKNPTQSNKKHNLNGHECVEVIIYTESGDKEIYYIDQSLPFVNYGDFKYSFDGFVIKSKRKINNFGIVEWQVDIEKISPPSNHLINFSEYFFQFGQRQ